MEKEAAARDPTVVEQGRSVSLEQAILRALEKSSSGAGTFTGKGSGARRRAIRRFG